MLYWHKLQGLRAHWLYFIEKMITQRTNVCIVPFCMYITRAGRCCPVVEQIFQGDLPVKEQSACRAKRRAPAGQREEGLCNFPMWYMPMHWAELIAYIVSTLNKIFYCFIKQLRLLFLSCNCFEIWGGGLTTAFYGWASLNKNVIFFIMLINLEHYFQTNAAS
jgi:hypothetical protein